MAARLFDHLDLRVHDLGAAVPFYDAVMPALGFPVKGSTAACTYYEAARDHPKPEFVALVEDRAHVANGSRVAFWSETKEAVDRLGPVLAGAGAAEVEGPMFCPEYSPTYYAVFFADPSGNRLELACRVAPSHGRP
jgi:catechol 2,3-dioxygenase-like lactoylglutathione lyase family enzyme